MFLRDVRRGIDLKGKYTVIGSFYLDFKTPEIVIELPQHHTIFIRVQFYGPIQQSPILYHSIISYTFIVTINTHRVPFLSKTNLCVRPPVGLLDLPQIILIRHPSVTRRGIPQYSN